MPRAADGRKDGVGRRRRRWTQARRGCADAGGAGGVSSAASNQGDGDHLDGYAERVGAPRVAEDDDAAEMHDTLAAVEVAAITGTASPCCMSRAEA